MLTGSGIIALCLLVGLAAALLILLGLVGREVRTPPTCVRCRFDLSGHEDARRGRFPVTCPECGLVILHDAQITRTRRERRRGALRVGLAGAVLCVGAIASIAMATGGTLDVYRLMSTPRLLKLSEGGSAEAFDALVARADQDLLTDEQWARIAENAVQEITTKQRRVPSYGVLGPPQVVWSSLYPRVVRKGIIDRETAIEHATRMVALDLELPPVLRAGEAMPFRVTGAFRRDPAGQSWYGAHGVDARVVGVRLNGRTLLPPESDLPATRSNDAQTTNSGSISARWLWEGTDRLPVLSDATAGPNTIEVDVRLTSQFSIGGGEAMITNIINANSPLPWLDVTVSRTVDLDHPAPPHAVPAVPPWNTETTVLSALSRKCDCGRAPGVRLRLSTTDGTHEKSVAFVDVYVAVGDNEPWYLGNQRIRAGESWSEVMLTDEQAAAIERHGPATLRIVPTPWNADLYFDRPAFVVSGDDITRTVVFEDDADTDDPDEE